MVSSFLTPLSDDLRILFLSVWLDIRSLVTLDVAVSNHMLRPGWMMILQCLRCSAIDNWGQSMSSLVWLSRRGIRASRLQMKVNTWRVRGFDILLPEIGDLVYLGLNGCSNITDHYTMDIVTRCRWLRDIKLQDYLMVTDAGVSALSHGCSHLQSVDLSRCNKVTDAGVTASSYGCGQLNTIYLGDCSKVTDAGVVALSHGRGQLQSTNLAY